MPTVLFEPFIASAVTLVMRQFRAASPPAPMDTATKVPFAPSLSLTTARSRSVMSSPRRLTRPAKDSTPPVMVVRRRPAPIRLIPAVTMTSLSPHA